MDLDSRGARIAILLLGIVVGAAAGAVTLQLLFGSQEDSQSTRRSGSSSEKKASKVLAAAGNDGAPSEGAESSASAPKRQKLREPNRPPRPLPPITNMYDWPREPNAPMPVDDKQFTEAFARLCGPETEDDVRAWYSGWVLGAARQFGADPFLLAALVYRQSGCQRAGGDHGIGLTGLAPEMYEDDIRDGHYHYRAFVDGKWKPRSLDISRFQFERSFIKAPESNLYFAAAFLRAWREQKRGLFVSHVHKEYRHHVSHFIWGDVVKSPRQEEWILTDRRRMLQYYGAIEAARPVRWRGFVVGCPLDGCPRAITSTLGDTRAGGKRAHRGVDFESTKGEPVRAIADGVVTFAGVDLPGKANNRRLPIYAQRSVGKSLMGAGGLYVCIRHPHPGDKKKNFVSCSMHLEAVTVAQGRKVERGTLIGRVGRTGIKVSAPHLHFEIHAEDGIHAADEVLDPLVLGDPTVRPPPERKPEAKQASN